MSILNDYIRFKLNTDKFTYGEINWMWSDNKGFLRFTEKSQTVNMIILFNISICLDGGGGTVSINNAKYNGKLIYQTNNFSTETIVSPFLLPITGNEVVMTCSQLLTYGFNYVTVTQYV